MTNELKEDQALEALFEAARSDAPVISPDFLNRLGEEAERFAAAPKPVAIPKPVGPTFWQRLSGLFAASGLSGAAALGVWLGFAMPDILSGTPFYMDESGGLTEFLPTDDLALFSE